MTRLAGALALCFYRRNGLSPAQRLVYLAIINSVASVERREMPSLPQQFTRSARLSSVDLVHLTGLGRRTVVRAVAVLGSRGFVRVTPTRNRRGGRGKNLFSIPARLPDPRPLHLWLGQPGGER